jgi:SET domain-containing protein
MFFVEHYVASSEIAGVGLFSKNDIQKGELIWAFDFRFILLISDAEIAAMPPPMQASVLKYCYRGLGKDRLVGAYYYCADDSKFMNHAADPNTTWLAEGDRYIAARDIAAGTEITCSYADFCTEGEACFAFGPAA